jgi:hypothetical protein
MQCQHTHTKTPEAAHLVRFSREQRLAEHGIQRELRHAATQLRQLTTVVERTQRV